MKCCFCNRVIKAWYYLMIGTEAAHNGCAKRRITVADPKALGWA